MRFQPPLENGKYTHKYWLRGRAEKPNETLGKLQVRGNAGGT